MAIVVEGMVGLEEMLLRLDTTTKKRSLTKLVEKAQQIQEIAIQMAPRDIGNLEDAIKVRPEPGEGAGRDESGRFVRTEVEVYVEMDKPVPERPGKVIGDYAYIMHEELTPYGPKQLGELSREKQAEVQYQVGGGYLARAAQMVEETIEGDIAAYLLEKGLT